MNIDIPDIKTIDLNNDQKINYDEFPVIDCNITYSNFFETFMMSNQACLIKNVTSNWNSRKLWIQNDLPNFHYLNKTYGTTSVHVHNCSETQDYNNPKPIEYKFQNYLEYWKHHIINNYPQDMPKLYLKDWHLQNNFPKDHFYDVPVYFTSDWLNEYLVENSLDDYRFVYMGTKGTWSPFHVDVMTSYSWSVNICGQKRWILFPPGVEDKLRDHLNNFPQDITELTKNIKHFQVIQNAGDAIFVPSKWHHQVWNLKDTISINHNWINGCNIKTIWKSIEKNLSEIKDKIEDCRDMEDFLDHCQVMLRASFGMNFEQFYDLISYIAEKRLAVILNNTPIDLPGNRRLGWNHAIFDLISIKNTLALFIEHQDVENINCFKTKSFPTDLLCKIDDTLIKKSLII